MNKWIGIGRLTRDPDYKQTPQGTSVATFSIAINRQFNKNESDFINCVAWRQQAEFLSKYGKKGRLLAVEGRIQTRNYENKEGRKVYVTEIVADRVEFLDPKGKSDKPAGGWDDLGHEIETDDDETPF